MGDLDRQVAEAIGYEYIKGDRGVRSNILITPEGKKLIASTYHPSRYWSQAGPLLEEFKLSLIYEIFPFGEDYGWAVDGNSSVSLCKTPQEAICKAVIALKELTEEELGSCWYCEQCEKPMCEDGGGYTRYQIGFCSEECADEYDSVR